MTTLRLSRILLLLKKQFIENRKAQLFIILGAIAVFFFFLLGQYILLNDKVYSKSFHIILFMYGSIIFGAVNASFSFKEFRKNSYRTQDLVLPVSSIEKFISNFLYTGVIFLFVFLALFFVADILACSVHGLFSNTGMAKFDYVFYFQKAFFSISDNPVIFTRFVILWYIVNALFTFGSVKFKEFPLVYTFIVYIGYSTGIAILNIFLLLSWKTGFIKAIEEIGSAMPNPFKVISFLYSNSSDLGSFMTYIGVIFFTMLYAITMFMIKEKEA